MVTTLSYYTHREQAEDAIQVLLADYQRCLLHEGRATIMREVNRLHDLIKPQTKRWLVLHYRICLDNLDRAEANFKEGGWECSAKIHKGMFLDLRYDPEVEAMMAAALVRRRKMLHEKLAGAESLTYELDELWDHFGSLGRSANIEG